MIPTNELEMGRLIDRLAGDNEDLGDALESMGMLFGLIPYDREIESDQAELETIVRSFMFAMPDKFLEKTVAHIKSCRK